LHLPPADHVVREEHRQRHERPRARRVRAAGPGAVPGRGGGAAGGGGGVDRAPQRGAIPEVEVLVPLRTPVGLVSILEAIPGDERGRTAPAATAHGARAAGSGGSGAGPVLLLAAGRAVAFAATFATPLVLARVFDQAEFGTYKQLFVVCTTLAALAHVGMPDSLLHVLASSPGRCVRCTYAAL